MLERGFNKILIGYSLSQFGDRLNQVALFWYVYQTTESSRDMAILSTFAALPYLLFGFLAGYIVDRLNEKYVLIASDIIRAVLMSLLFYSTYYMDIKLVSVIAIIFLSSCASAFFEPAKTKIITKIVDKDELLKANSRLSSWQQFARLFAPMISGTIISIAHPSLFFLLNSVTFVTSAIFISNIPYYKKNRKEECGNNSLGKVMLSEGVSFFLNSSTLLSLLILFSVTNFLFHGISIVIPPVLSEKIFNASSYGYGLLLSGFSFGLLIGAVILRKLQISVSTKSFVLCIVFGGLSFSLIGLVNYLWIAVLLFFLCGIFFNISSILFITKLQKETPQSSQGSVFSLVNTLTIGISPISTAVVSYFILFIDNQAIVAYAGLGIVILSLIFYLKLRKQVTYND